MGWWVVDADTLAGSRFVLSPLAEATSALQVLLRGTAQHPGERAWLAEHRAGFARRMADPVTARLAEIGLGMSWNATFLTPTPTGEQDVERELDAVLRTPPEQARADLEESLGGALPAGLRRDDLPERAATLLRWVWSETVLPTWPRRRRIMEADVIARTGQLTRGGWAATLDRMRPGMRWLGGGRLQINANAYPPRDLSGARLLFVPVTPSAGWVSWEEERRYAVVYPCAGVLAETSAAPRSLGRLLGPARAQVLMLLDTPKSTTQVVALTGQGLGSVGRHLRVLLEARLVERRRAGRSVLYYRTTAGQVLVDAQA